MPKGPPDEGGPFWFLLEFYLKKWPNAVDWPLVRTLIVTFPENFNTF